MSDRDQDRSRAKTPAVQFGSSPPPLAAPASLPTVLDSSIPLGQFLVAKQVVLCGDDEDQAEESAPGSPVGALLLGGSLSRVPQRAATMPAISARVWPTSCCSTM